MVILLTVYFIVIKVLEKHFALDKKLSGNDCYYGVELCDFKIVLKNLKK